jgi:hypothetical protein
MRTAGFLIAGRSGTATPGLFRFLRRVISSGHYAEAYIRSVPGIDGANYKRQTYKFFIIEVWPDISTVVAVERTSISSPVSAQGTL